MLQAHDKLIELKSDGCGLYMIVISLAKEGGEGTLAQSNQVVWHNHSVSKQRRAAQKNQKPCILWFTGFSGSGKSSVANAVEAKLYERGRHSYLLDGDNVRHGLNKGLGFSTEDRIENIRRVGELSKLFLDAGLIVLTAFISPFRTERRLVRDLVSEDEFIEIFIDTPLSACEQRDPKGLYKKARAGEIKNFTGIDSPYEIPEHAEIVVKNDQISVEAAADQIVRYLEDKGYV